jgi:hypothetical protein
MRLPRLSIVALGLSASCASAPEPQPEERKLDPNWRPGSIRIAGEDDDDGMTLEQSKGALDQRDVDQVLAKRVKSLTPCYEQAGAAQKFASGQVKLRFFVASSGEVSNVLVVSSDVGNFDVERCLITEGRRLKFPPPEGGRATDFEYSLVFHATGEHRVVDWDEEVLAKEVAHLSPQLAPCGSLGPTPVKAVVYIQPGGAVASAGLACGGPVDMTASACVVEQIRKWRLPDDRQHMVRASFMVSARGASPSGPPPAARGRGKRAPQRRRG